MKARSLLLLLSIIWVSPSAFAAMPGYVPMKVIQTEEVIFPRAAKDLGITTGQASVTIQVDETGKLTDYLVTSYSFPAFAEAAVNGLKRWQYQPAYLRDQPHSATVDLTFNYESKGLVVVDLTVNSYVELRNFQLRPGTYGYRACTLRQLDRIPTPTKVVKPIVPFETVQPGAKVTVDFYIDEKGHVRLPAVSREMGEANETLSAAAIAAVSQWEFEPPLSRGLPVLVAARQDFNFVSKP